MKYFKKQELVIVGNSAGHNLPNGSIVTVLEVNKYDYYVISRDGIEFYVNQQDLKSL